MIKTTVKEIKKLVACAYVEDITHSNIEDYKRIINKEKYLDCIAYSIGVYGVNAKVYRGKETGTLYTITGRTQALFIFG